MKNIVHLIAGLMVVSAALFTGCTTVVHDHPAATTTTQTTEEATVAQPVGATQTTETKTVRSY